MSALFFLIFGGVFASLQNDGKEYAISYSSDKYCLNKTSCQIIFEIQETLENPVFLYYELENFYQNYDTIYTSFNNDQISGKIVDKKSLGECGKAITNGFMGYKISPLTNESLLPNQISVPCGYLAYTLFNGN